MKMLQDIQIVIPKNTIELLYFQKILALCDNLKIYNHNLIQSNLTPDLKPSTSFIFDKAVDPQISFIADDIHEGNFWVGKLPVGFNLDKPDADIKPRRKPVTINKTDNAGEYLEVKWPSATYNQLNFKQLYDRLINKIVTLDHLGINIYPRLLPKAAYQQLKNKVVKISYLVDYPLRQEWPFIIPATQAEQETKISSIKKRDPKFEFVYNFDYPYPEIQLDIQTKLTAKETRTLFPSPYGYHDPDPVAGAYCSRVFIYTGWQNVSLRIDLRYNLPSFSSSQWLIREGKRS